MKARVLAAVLVLLAVLVVSSGPAAAGGPELLVAPGTVNRYDTYRVTVVTDPNASFSLGVYGPDSFYLDLSNRTDYTGTWSSTEQAWYPFGSYLMELRLGNETLLANLTVDCNARCIGAILSGAGQDQSNTQSAFLVAALVYILLLDLAFMVPISVVVFRDRARRARERAAFNDREFLSSGWVRLRSFIQPGDQVTDPRDVKNPRIAADQDRRKHLEELNEATSHRFLEWNPAHIGVIHEIVGKLDGDYARQRTLQPSAIPTAATWTPKESPAPAAEPAAIPDGIYRSPSIEPSSGSAEIRDRPRAPQYSEGNSARRKDDMETMDRWVKRQRVNGRRGRLIGIGLVVLGILLVAMAVLVTIAYFGIRIAALSALWIPIPSDSIKSVLGAFLGGAALAAGVLVLRAPRVGSDA